MNDYKFCFIICANREQYLEECLWYIEKLNIPDGYETEKIVIWDAASMASGYNKAMAQSDAKYKIYLHEDVMVVNRKLLSELLEAFQESTVGMVGILGKREIDPLGTYTERWDAGGAEVCTVTDTSGFKGSFNYENKWIDVTGADGMLLATQYDLLWEECFDGWFFYDLSQCMNMRQAGYRVVVPRMSEDEKCWVFHDAGQCEYMEWEKYREKFCEKYASFGHTYETRGQENVREEIENKRARVEEAFENDDFEETVQRISQLGERALNSRVAYIMLFLKVRAEELMAFGETNYPSAVKIEDFIREYDEIKFMLRRIYFGYEDESWAYLYKKVCDGQCSMKMIWQAVQICVVDRNSLWWNIFAKYQREIRTLIRRGDILPAERILLQLDKKWRGKEGNILAILMRSYHRDIEKDSLFTVFDVFREPEELTEYYIRVKYYMRRLEFGLPEKYWLEVYDYFIDTNTSDYLIFDILIHNIFYREACCRNLSKMFAQREGADSVRAGIYAQLAESNAKR